jgi:hypothetical protein
MFLQRVRKFELILIFSYRFKMCIILGVEFKIKRIAGKKNLTEFQNS